LFKTKDVKSFPQRKNKQIVSKSYTTPSHSCKGPDTQAASGTNFRASLLRVQPSESISEIVRDKREKTHKFNLSF